MAKCDREFLIPYLEDICTLELMNLKLTWERYSTQNKINNIENIHIPSKPQPPEKEKLFSEGLGFYIMVVMGIILSLFILSIFAPFAWIICAVKLVESSNEIDERYEKKLEEYRKATKRRNEAIERCDKERAKLPALREKLSEQNKEIQMLSDLLQKAYSANIIPGQYRNLYASVFLYDYFSKARFADDLDMVLNTYVLEQIKARLDTIITQLSEVLINQSISLSKQEDAMEQQEKYQKRMEHKISQIQASNEEQEMYLDMIESHTRITAYFAAENYFNRRS